MEHIKEFNQFIKKSKFDRNTELYLEGNITFSEWEMNFDSINEGKVINYITKKILPVLKTIQDKLTTVGLKGIKILTKLSNILLKYLSKYPALRIALIILIIILVIGISAASASTVGDPNSGAPDIIAASIQYVSDLSGHAMLTSDVETVDYLLEIKKCLMDLKDGELNDEWVKSVRVGTETLIDNVKEMETENPSYFEELLEKGRKLLNSDLGSITNSKGTEYYY